MLNRRTGFALIATLAGLVVSSQASADTLYTTPAHTASVAVGATANVLSGTWSLTGSLSGTSFTDDCVSSTLTLQVAQNSGTLVAATVVSGSFSTPCSTAAPSGDFPWTVTVGGSAATSGSDQVWANTTWDDVSMNAVSTLTGTFGDASGSPPANGAYTRQPSTTGAPLCFVLADAGTLQGVFTNVTLDTTYCVEGGAATAWSLAPPPVVPTRSYLRADPVGNTLTGVSTLSYRAGDATTLTNGVGTITCGGAAMDLLVGPSGGTGVTGSLNALSLSSCTDTIPLFSVTSCTRTASPTTAVLFNANTATGGTQTLSNLLIRCPVDEAALACYYGATSISGTVANTPATTTYNNASITHTVPAGVTDDLGASFCGTNATFSAKLTGLTQTTTGTPLTLKQS